MTTRTDARRGMDAMTDKQVRVTVNLTLIAVCITIVATVGGIGWKLMADRAGIDNRIDKNSERLRTAETWLSDHENRLRQQGDMLGRIDENVKSIKEHLRARP